MPTTDPDEIALAVRLGDALGAASRPRHLDGELRDAVAATRSLFGAAACSVALLQPDEESLRFAAADGAGADRIVGTVIGTDRGIAGWVAVTGQPIVVADVRRDPRFARDVAESTDYVPSSIMAAPLTDRGGVVLGVIEVLDRADSGAGSGRDLDVLALVATRIASVVALAARFDRLGAVVIGGLTGAADVPVAERMAATAATEDDAALAATAAAIARLAAAGPRERRLVRGVLEAVLDSGTVSP